MRASFTTTLDVDGTFYTIYDAAAACNSLRAEVYRSLPYSLRILAENSLRTIADPQRCALVLSALIARRSDVDLPFRPGRVVLQDLLGTPALVDLAGLRDAVAESGGDPLQVNPVTPVHLVVDHSLNVEQWGSAAAMAENMRIERARNAERFAFLEWANAAFDNVTIIPSGTGILHQINLERLTPVIATQSSGALTLAYPDTLVGTDSHTTMINAIGVLGWGVGGIEAEAAMLGQTLMLRLPAVVGVRLEGVLPPGYIATDIALALSEILRATGVIGAYIEFFGPALAQLSLADRATIANMAPEFGATAALFPIDQRSIAYLRMSGRSPANCALVSAYAKRQGLWSDMLADVVYERCITLDLATIARAIAGPQQPHQRIVLRRQSDRSLATPTQDALAASTESTTSAAFAAFAASGSIPDAAVVIAAITSCTNTANPRAVLAAGLLARKARARGLKRAPWTKTSFAPGSRVVGAYLAAAGLDHDLNALGFHIIGYGCTTCNGMSGPLLSSALEQLIRSHNLRTVAVTSGNRNFEGRIHPLAQEAFIMSPPLVVAYAIAGTANIDPERDPLGHDAQGRAVFLHELWPSDQELDALEQQVVTAQLFEQAYADLPLEDAARMTVRTVNNSVAARYAWNPASTYIQRPPYWHAALGATDTMRDLSGMRMLALLGDHITTDHISPSGAILPDSDAGQYLLARGVAAAEFNSYGTRRGNHEAAQRATFASPRLKNQLVPGREGAYTRLLPDNTVLSIFAAAQIYAQRAQPLLVVAGQNYGSGSSRDWAAKGPRLLGVRVVLAESFERIHRANLAGMGILPLQFIDGVSRITLALSGDEIIDIEGVDAALQPNQILQAVIHRVGVAVLKVAVLCRLDTDEEIGYFAHGGLLPQLLRQYVPVAA